MNSTIRRMLVSAREISKHCTPNDCWVVIDGHIWDLTEFAPRHPGGFASIYSLAGYDATEAYNEVHSSDLVKETLGTKKLVGKLDTSSIFPEWKSRLPQKSKMETSSKPPLQIILNAHDFERVAQEHFSEKAWAFFSSAATDLVSVNANRSLYNRIWFRPRLLRDVKSVNTACRIQGVESALPVLIAPVALAKLANPIGEKGFATSAAQKGIIHCIPITASFPIEEICSVVPSVPRTFFFQLYVNKNLGSSESLLRHVWELGIRVLFVTIDAPVPGKREADERVKNEGIISLPMTSTTSHDDRSGSGLTRTTGSFISSSFCWADLAWLKKHWPGKIVIKGIQSVEDAQAAVQAGVDGIVLSNHGGRNLDTSPPALLTLIELQRHSPSIFTKLEVLVDGGIRRGTDILKAICLGGKAVLLGRPFLYALGYGQEGPEHLIDILQSELETAMRLVGITDLSQAHPGLVNTQDLHHLTVDTLSHSEMPYQGLIPKL